MASLFPTHSSQPRRPKTHVSLGLLPRFIDDKQPPTKRSPWHQLLSTPFASSLTITLPAATYDALWPLLEATSSTAAAPFRYAKVILKLVEILTADFFTHYIKSGNILLLSEGQPGVSDWVARLSDGKLHLEMTRDMYERCGLQGVPLDTGGGARKHTKERWVIEIDLRAPSMVRGRKGFERLIRAAEEVLNQGKLWLFRDLGTKSENAEQDEVLKTFYPTWIEVLSKTRDIPNVQVPNALSTPTSYSDKVPPIELHDDLHELVEYLDLVRLKSPRLQHDDKVDPYISRYSIPDVNASTPNTNLKVVAWTGLLDPVWCTRLLIDIIRQSRRAETKLNTNDWVVFAVGTHRTEALGQSNGCMTILQPVSATQRGVDNEDTTMSVDIPETDQDDNKPAGLQRFTCFQFVDTVTV